MGAEAEAEGISGMIGYDVGARMGLDSDGSEHFGTTDAWRVRTESRIGDDDASRDGSDDAEILNEAAEVAAKLNEAGMPRENSGADLVPGSDHFPLGQKRFHSDGKGRQVFNGYGQADMDESFYNTVAEKLNRGQGGALDPMFLTADRQFAASTGTKDMGAMSGSFGQLAHRFGDLSAAGAAAQWDVERLPEHPVSGGYPASYAANGEEGFGQLGPILHAVSGIDDREADDRIGVNFGEHENLAGRGSDQLEDISLLKENVGTTGAYGAGSRNVLPGDELEALYGRVAPEHDAQNVQRVSDDLQTQLLPSRVDRLTGQEEVAEMGMENTGGITVLGMDTSAASDIGPAVRTLDFPAIWGILKNAERALPKAGFAMNASEGQGVGDGTKPDPEDWLGSLAKLFGPGATDRDDAQFSNVPVEKMAHEGGRVGPTGHRNDPIYTVAISSGGGTLMPMVPTPGSSTRSPPIPGQRNLA